MLSGIAAGINIRPEPRLPDVLQWRRRSRKSVERWSPEDYASPAGAGTPTSAAKPAKVRGAAQACSIVCCDNCKPTKARKAFALTPARCGAGHGAGRGAGCRAPVGGGEAGDARRGRKAGPGAAPQDAACGDAGLR